MTQPPSKSFQERVRVKNTERGNEAKEISMKKTRLTEGATIEIQGQMINRGKDFKSFEVSSPCKTDA